jgi:hypothetical protein
MLRLLIRATVWLVRAALRSRDDLVLENLALRQQLAIYKDKRPRPQLTDSARAFWVGLRAAWPGWRNALILVQPDTVVRWHRQGFGWFWRRKCRSRPRGRSPVTPEIRDLTRRMATENRWGAPRIHAELLKLGFTVSERTVSRYLPRRPTSPDAVKRWLAFLRNHRDVIAGVDFFTVPTATFRLLYVFFVIHHDRRRILQLAVTDHPYAEWVVQQLREAFPYDSAPRYLILDRDGRYGNVVPDTLRAWGLKPVRISRRSPWQNGVSERWVLTVRRELLDHVVVLSADHLRRLLRSYLAYYHEDRCHLSLGKDSPNRREVTPRPSPAATVIALPRVGGLHHRYEWSEERRAA